MSFVEPQLTLPPAEAAFLHSYYDRAGTILEYGSGGSTVLAANMTDKKIFSVESDKAWSENLRSGLAARKHETTSFQMHHVDIGETKKWGKAVSDKNWRDYWKYPMSVWQRDDFQQPDVILVDGLYRPACVVTAMLMTNAKVDLLFDDFMNPRKNWQEVRPRFEALGVFIEPVEICGRMARFEILPDQMPKEHLPLAISLFFRYF